MEARINRQRLANSRNKVYRSGRFLFSIFFFYSKPKDSKQEYGTDSYNRPGRGPIGPSRAGWPGSSVQKQGHSTVKKNEQAILKRHRT